MTKQTYGHVYISAVAQKILQIDVFRRGHIEACGLLLGSIDGQGNWHIERAYPLRNIHNSPVYFEFAPEELLEAELAFPGQIAGVYHSHPSGHPKASSTDRENMRRVNVEQGIPWVWLIIRGPFNSQQEQLSMLAYHHYERLGLREISIESETGQQVVQHIHEEKGEDQAGKG